MIRRVLMTADTIGGVWTYAMELCQAFAEHQVEVALATLGTPPDRAQAAEAAGLPGLQLYESAYRLEWMREPWQDVDEAGAWLLDLERRLVPDIVHLNGYCHGDLPFTAPVLVVGHSCVLSWWQAVKGEAAPAEWQTYAERVARGLRAADLVVAPTAAMLRSLADLYGPLPRTQVIPNGRRRERFPPLPKEPFVLTAGRLWDEAKNVRALARVARRLSWPVLLAGDGAAPEPGDGRRERPERPEREAREIWERWGEPLQNLRPLGRLAPQDLASWLGRAAIYALPARYEPFGLSILEAALAGCALVLGDIPSLRELWDGCALFVPPEDDGRLAEALESLIRDPMRRRLLAAEARRRARRFGPDPMAESYLRAYRDATEPRSAPVSNSERALHAGLR
jgi:glycosyltransferase involved in cell wall biosynthesis